ncbi:hypothetical protein EDC04DRAFT_1132102 [Pisolithus marmoratus]|nr:hypothetical protein EDC04DRAFT_1132102 [Pisolithus marmoratus]
MYRKTLGAFSRVYHKQAAVRGSIKQFRHCPRKCGTARHAAEPSTPSPVALARIQMSTSNFQKEARSAIEASGVSRVQSSLDLRPRAVPLLTKALATYKYDEKSFARGVRLTTSNAVVSPDGYNRSTIVVNGGTPGPFLSSRKGSTFSVNVVNSLTDESMNRSGSIVDAFFIC